MNQYVFRAKLANYAVYAILIAIQVALLSFVIYTFVKVWGSSGFLFSLLLLMGYRYHVPKVVYEQVAVVPGKKIPATKKK